MGLYHFLQRSKKYTILEQILQSKAFVNVPECHIGQLSVIKSVTTKKRFIGCTNFQNGCKASAPLLQKAMLKFSKLNVPNVNGQL